MRKINRVQRLAKREESAVIKRIFWLSVVSLILIVVIFTVGTSLLGKFADLLDKVFKNNTNISQEGPAPPPPILDTLPHATNQDTITISGFSNNSSRAEIYNGSQLSGETNVDNDKFEFKDFKLNNGENKLTLKSFDANGKSSEFSQEVVVVLDKKSPNLEVTNPTDGQTFVQNNKIKVSGKTEKDAQVFANGFLANVDSSGNFDVSIPLVEGENKIEVKALDDAGNTTKKEIKVEFKK